MRKLAGGEVRNGRGYSSRRDLQKVRWERYNGFQGGETQGNVFCTLLMDDGRW